MGGCWSRTLFYCQGLGSYTRSGFDSAYSTFDHLALTVDLSSKVFIVTGANSGIGAVVARELGARGAVVHMLCRNKAKGDAAAAAAATFAKKQQSVHFVVHEVDMARPQQIKEFARKFAASNNRLDGLVNNAGCMASERVLTPEGLESSFACNVLGMFLLTEELMPMLEKTSGARVVTVTSAGMLTEGLDVVDPQYQTTKWDGTQAYARHKRAQVELTHAWAVAHASVQFMAVHPGWVDTPGLQAGMPSFYSQHRRRLRTPEQGADSVLWAAAAPAAMQIPNGSFVGDRRVQTEHVLWGGTTARPGDLERLVRYLKELAARGAVTVNANGTMNASGNANASGVAGPEVGVVRQ